MHSVALIQHHGITMGFNMIAFLMPCAGIWKFSIEYGIHIWKFEHLEFVFYLKQMFTCSRDIVVTVLLLDDFIGKQSPIQFWWCRDLVSSFGFYPALNLSKFEILYSWNVIISIAPKWFLLFSNFVLMRWTNVKCRLNANFLMSLWF